MDALVGPVVVASSLLVLAGVLKLARPSATAGALRALRLPSSLWLVRVLGIVEIAVGGAAAITLARPLLVLVAALYLGFAGFIAAALTASTPIQSCGCLGQTDTPPSGVHLGLNLASAAVAFAAALTETQSLSSTISDQPWAGLPFLFLTAVCVYLCVIVATVLPLTFRSDPAA